MTAISLGLDFGTEAVRALLVDATGRQRGEGGCVYENGQITEVLPGSLARLPPQYALQHPTDWIEAAAVATHAALSDANLDGDQVVGIGVDFTSCTMLPARWDGTPLCLLEAFSDQPLAWPKLWKHHGAVSQTERMNAIARQRNESFLSRYGGTIGLEWLLPKMLETIELAPDVAEAAEVWLEAGDWFVWQLVGGTAETLTRSTCQAGYKGLWSAAEGYPSSDYLRAVDPRLETAVTHRLPGVMRAPGERAGTLTPLMAARFGLASGTPVSTAIIDAHAAVPGVGEAEAGTLVMVMGTSSCHMLNAVEAREVAGIAGMVDGGILPGLVGYETGQAAVGDAFAWLKRLLNIDTFDDLAMEAQRLPPGADGVACLDWMTGCRTPLMDGTLRGVFHGVGLEHGPAHFYLALMEASAFGLRWIVEILRDGGVPIKRFVCTGGLPHHNRHFVEVYADVLGETLEIHPAQQGPATGAAVLGMIAAGSAASGFATISEAAQAMAGVAEQDRNLVQPRRDRTAQYDRLYAQYRRWAEIVQQNPAGIP